MWHNWNLSVISSNPVAIEAAHLTFWCEGPSMPTTWSMSRKEEGTNVEEIPMTKGRHDNQRGRESSQGPAAGHGWPAADCKEPHGHGSNNHDEGYSYQVLRKRLSRLPGWRIRSKSACREKGVLHPSLGTTTGDHSTQPPRMVIHGCHLGETIG